MRKHSSGVAIALAITVSACGQSAPPAGGGAGVQMPPPQVGVVSASPETVTLVTELPGRLEAVRVAQVRARVPGIVQKRLFREGSDVKAGQVLYQLDPASYRATLDSTLAAVARSEALLAQTTATVDRYRPLVEANAISRQDYVNAQAAQKQAAADLAAGRAAVRAARLNLGYATVSSPISGRIGKSAVTPGALVTADQPQALATVQQLDPMYVDITRSSQDLLRLRRDMPGGRLRGADGEALIVTLLLEDGNNYPQQGKLAFSDVTIDPTTDSVTLRAVFPNPEHRLLPGMYLRAILAEGMRSDAILLPQQAVIRDAQGNASALVVDANGTATPRPLQLGRSVGPNWLIESGLQPGEKVIRDGLQKVRPGSRVTPVERARDDATPSSETPR